MLIIYYKFGIKNCFFVININLIKFLKLDNLDFVVYCIVIYVLLWKLY